MRALGSLFAWAGGAVFVASLVLCTWWYLIPLGRTFGPLSWPRVVFDTALFSAFALHHSVFARGAVKRAIALVVPAPLLRVFYIWTASVLLMIVCVLWQPVGGEWYDVHGAAAAVHAAVQIAGVWLIAAAVRLIDPLDLAGIRPPAADLTALQIRGPYRLVRHPIYLGWMLAVFGHAHMTGDRVLFAVISSFYLLIAVPWEEGSLRGVFGDAYDRYCLQVRWRVIPFVY